MTEAVGCAELVKQGSCPHATASHVCHGLRVLTVCIAPSTHTFPLVRQGVDAEKVSPCKRFASKRLLKAVQAVLCKPGLDMCKPFRVLVRLCCSGLLKALRLRLSPRYVSVGS